MRGVLARMHDKALARDPTKIARIGDIDSLDERLVRVENKLDEILDVMYQINELLDEYS
jgi:hypothetical protein